MSLSTPITPNQSSPCQVEVNTGPMLCTIVLRGRIDSSNAAALYNDLQDQVRRTSSQVIKIDLDGVTYMDDFGISLLAGVKQAVLRKNLQFALDNIPPHLEKILAIHHFDTLGTKPALRRPRAKIPNLFVNLGAATLDHVNDLAYMTTFLGTSCLAFLQIIRHPRKIRRQDVLSYMQRTGVDALPIVGLISFLLGLIMAFMSSVQLQQFGANIYVASLVSLAMTRELGPIMTAIIVAGRSGSAYAAEIGSMKISEEIDALTVMGFDPHLFLVVPKLLATLLVVPMLTLFSDLFAIVGGLIVGIGMLDLTINSYITQTISTLDLFDVFWGVGKSALFALLIAWIGCLRGFQVKGGAESVGRATTSAVVSAIFLIILADSLFAVILRYWE